MNKFEDVDPKPSIGEEIKPEEQKFGPLAGMDIVERLKEKLKEKKSEYGEISNLINIKEVIRDAQDNEELKDVIQKTEFIWPEDAFDAADSILRDVLRETINELDRRKIKLNFSDKYLCLDCFPPRMPKTVLKEIKEKGYLICPLRFRYIGMKGTESFILENEKDFRLETSPSQIKKIELLQQAVDLLKSLYDKQTISSVQLNKAEGPLHKNINALSNRETWLYDKNNDDKIAKRLYKQEHVWLPNNLLNGSFEQALDSYLEEIIDFNTREIFSEAEKSEFTEFMHSSLEKVKDLIAMSSDKFQKIKDEWGKIEQENVSSSKAFSNIARTE